MVLIKNKIDCCNNVKCSEKYSIAYNQFYTLSEVYKALGNLNIYIHRNESGS